MKKLFCFLPILVLLACSGGKNKEKEPPTEIPVTSENSESVNETYGEAIIFMEGAYTTSTKLPHKQFDIYKAFDEDDKTYWATMQGAGPDEGLMLYFKSDTYLSEVKLQMATGVGLDEVKKVTVYANGKNLGDFPTTQPIKIGKEVRSLFFRMADLASVKRIDNQSGEGSSTIDEVTTQYIDIFDEKLSVGIAEVKFFGKNGDKLLYKPPYTLPGKVIASSTLSPETSYSTDLLFDSRKEFVWVEGVESAGEGETISIELENEMQFSGLEFLNGYQRSDKHYKSNARLKSFEFGLKGKPLEIYEISDRKEATEVKLKETLLGKSFVLKIKEVYPGEKYKDLAISEMRLLDGFIPFLVGGNQEVSKKALLEATKGKILGNALDKRFKSNVQEEFMVYDNSIIIRSDYTFVIYQNEEDQEANASIEKIADGGWEVVENKANYAKIRIFGKVTNLSESVDFYKGKSKQEFQQIFQDFLIIKKGSIQGTNFFGKFITDLSDGAFVDMEQFGADFVLDMRYATDSNFIGEQVYDCGRCLMRYEAAKALLLAQEKFTEKGYRIKFYDCYRPLDIQKRMWEKYPNASYVANPYKGIGSIHNRGGAVDMTIIDQQGKELDMGTGFDFFGKEAHQDYTNLPEEILQNRKILKETMETSGFASIRTEWWHYSFRNKTKFEVANTPIQC